MIILLSHVSNVVKLEKDKTQAQTAELDLSFILCFAERTPVQKERVYFCVSLCYVYIYSMIQLLLLALSVTIDAFSY